MQISSFIQSLFGSLLIVHIVPSFSYSAPVYKDSYIVKPGAKPEVFAYLDPSFALINRQSRRHALSQNCEELVQLRNALKQWKQHVSNSSSNTSSMTSTSTCVEEKRGSSTWYYLDVHDELPALVHKVYDRCATQQGPNCYNATLVASGILPFLRPTSPQELEFWVHSPLCQKLGHKASHQSGDVVLVRSHMTNTIFGQSMSHAFVYLNKEFSFSKPSHFQHSPYLLERTERTWKTYDVPSKCRFNQTENAESECPAWTESFRCQTMEQYLAAHPQLREQYTCAHKALVPAERALSKATIQSKAPCAAELQKVSAQLCKTWDQWNHYKDTLACQKDGWIYKAMTQRFEATQTALQRLITTQGGVSSQPNTTHK